MIDRNSERVFGGAQASAFVLGTVVGTGIYLKPGLVVGLLQHPWQVYLVWLLGGLFATAGALVYTELARNWPENGGPFLYLRETYGPWAASLLLAADIFLARPAAVGALASGLGLVWGLPPGPGLGLALFIVLALSGVQVLGARAQGWSQTVLTIFQFLPLLAILVLAPVVAVDPPQPWKAPPVEAQWAAAFLAVLWAYDGWYNITILAGEVQAPGRTLRRSLFGGMALVTTLYLLLNWVLCSLVERERLVEEPIGFLLLFENWELSWLGIVTQVSLSLALLATLNGTLACGARMIVAGASRGLLSVSVGSDPTGVRPTLSFTLWCLGVLLLFAGLSLERNLFDSLTEFTAVVVAMLSALTVTCIFHPAQFRQRPSSGALLAATGYLAVSSVLLVLLVLESNRLALGGVVTVGLLGTFLSLRSRGDES